MPVDMPVLHRVPHWGMKASMKAWMIKHWLYEAVMELSAYLKIEAYEEAKLVWRIAYDANRDLWLQDVIWYNDYKEIEEMLQTIYDVLFCGGVK